MFSTGCEQHTENTGVSFHHIPCSSVCYTSYCVEGAPYINCTDEVGVSNAVVPCLRETIGCFYMQYKKEM